MNFQNTYYDLESNLFLVNQRLDLYYDRCYIKSLFESMNQTSAISKG